MDPKFNLLLHLGLAAGMATSSSTSAPESIDSLTDSGRLLADLFSFAFEQVIAKKSLKTRLPSIFLFSYPSPRDSFIFLPFSLSTLYLFLSLTFFLLLPFCVFTLLTCTILLIKPFTLLPSTVLSIIYYLLLLLSIIYYLLSTVLSTVLSFYLFRLNSFSFTLLSIYP